MDIFNRPPAISEDTLQYAVYPPQNSTDKTSVTTFAASILAYVDSLLPDFLWHRDSFELKVVQSPDSNEWFLEGRMRVGDSVDDEWCVVWLLKQISSRWDFVISVFDSDGEFLLIEAAEVLPAWVKPTNSENRVWIHQNKLHLIPLSHISPPSGKRRQRRFYGSKESDNEGEDEDEDEDDFIGIQDALRLVRDLKVDTCAPFEVENLVWQRISKYPLAAQEHVHIAKAYLPVDIAKALSVNASLIQKPVETFYTRDAIQLRAAHRMSRFPPQPSILRTVKMTRTSYAQIIGQKFAPPKIFGRWDESEGTNSWRWRDIGMKIAIGFEMLYQESKSRTTPADNSQNALKSSSEARKEALRRSPDYIQYMQNLASTNYFKGEREGSKAWKLLEDKAAIAFVEARREDDSTRSSFATMVTAAINQAVPHIEPSQEEEHSDEWLNIDAKDFDDLLGKTFSKSEIKEQKDPHAMDIDGPNTESTQDDHTTKEQAKRLQDLAQKVERFVEGQGDIEGAKLEDENSSDEALSEFSDEEMSSSGDEGPYENNFARQEAMDKLVPALSEAEYGEMPASFHSNSQKVTKTAAGSDAKMSEPNEASSDSKPQTKPIRKPIFPREHYDGVDSDDETDDEENPSQDEESEEDRPQIVGDIEVDMAEEEEEFLEFSRQALGISDEQWRGIVDERKGRGAFVPRSVTDGKKPASGEGKPSQFREYGSEVADEGRKPDLNSFEAVMQAMDAELARSRKKSAPLSNKAVPTAQSKGKGKAKATTTEEEEDIGAAMDAELKAILEKVGDGDDDDEVEEPVDYNLIKNFLESFKSQGGLSGPVSNLAGMLQPGWKLPRDDS